MADANAEREWVVVPRWDDFQHYRDRDPKWIKVYSSLLRDDAYLDLSGHRRAILHGVWLAYAASSSKLHMSAPSLSRRLGMRVTTKDLHVLISAGWLEVASEPQTRESGWASRYVSEKTRELVLSRDGHECRDCGSSENLEIDHILPISAGGTGEVENLQTLCRRCNRSKQGRQSVAGPSSNGPLRERGREEKEKDQGRNGYVDVARDQADEANGLGFQIPAELVKEMP